MKREMVQSIIRAFKIIEAFNRKHKELSISDLADKTSLSKSTVHRLVSTLVELRILKQNPDNLRYQLGLKIFEIGQIAYHQMDLRHIAKESLERLSQLTGETTHLVVMDENEILYIDKIDSFQAVNMTSYIGQRLPAHSSAVGKILISYFSEEQLENYILCKGLPAKTKNTITDPDILKEKLIQVKKQGYSIDNEENEPYVRCVATCIKNYQGNPVAAISVSGPVMRMTDGKIKTITKEICSTAEEISALLGYKEDKFSSK